ncbi:MAG: hypothetical protein FWG08_07215 [Propionibacteriaceae bacterium]|nr:hypothetical protein [Propionibacteriaceae bacterium]
MGTIVATKIDEKNAPAEMILAMSTAIEGRPRGVSIALVIGESTAHVAVDALVGVVLLGVHRRTAEMIVMVVPVVSAGNVKRDTLGVNAMIVHRVIVRIVVKDTHVERIGSAEIAMTEVGVILDKTVVGTPEKIVVAIHEKIAVGTLARHEMGIHTVGVVRVVRVVDQEAGRLDAMILVAGIATRRILQGQGHGTP